MMARVRSDMMLFALDEELDRLRRIRDLLAGSPMDAISPSVSATHVTRKRQLTPEGRQRIVNAQRRRWAAQKGGA